MIRLVSDASIKEASLILQKGGLVAFPTETVYGLGANALDPLAVARIFEAKKRPHFDPLIVHVADVAAARELWAFVPPEAEVLMHVFWPGPLTIVLPKNPKVPDIVTSGLSTVGVRMPDHAAAAALLRSSGLAIAAPSANPFGRTSPTEARHVEEDLADAVDLILDGGKCAIGVESTVIELIGPGGRARSSGQHERLSEMLPDILNRFEIFNKNIFDRDAWFIKKLASIHGSLGKVAARKVNKRDSMWTRWQKNRRDLRELTESLQNLEGTYFVGDEWKVAEMLYETTLHDVSAIPWEEGPRQAHYRKTGELNQDRAGRFRPSRFSDEYERALKSAYASLRWEMRFGGVGSLPIAAIVGAWRGLQGWFWAIFGSSGWIATVYVSLFGIERRIPRAFPALMMTDAGLLVPGKTEALGQPAAAETFEGKWMMGDALREKRVLKQIQKATPEELPQVLEAHGLHLFDIPEEYTLDPRIHRHEGVEGGVREFMDDLWDTTIARYPACEPFLAGLAARFYENIPPEDIEEVRSSMYSRSAAHRLSHWGNAANHRLVPFIARWDAVLRDVREDPHVGPEAIGSLIRQGILTNDLMEFSFRFSPEGGAHALEQIVTKWRSMNAEEGRMLLSDAKRLNLISCNELEEAARKVVELAGR